MTTHGCLLCLLAIVCDCLMHPMTVGSRFVTVEKLLPFLATLALAKCFVK